MGVVIETAGKYQDPILGLAQWHMIPLTQNQGGLLGCFPTAYITTPIAFPLKFCTRRWVKLCFWTSGFRNARRGMPVGNIAVSHLVLATAVNRASETAKSNGYIYICVCVCVTAIPPTVISARWDVTVITVTLQRSKASDSILTFDPGHYGTFTWYFGGLLFLF
jgi:hypothetical protein